MLISRGTRPLFAPEGAPAGPAAAPAATPAAPAAPAATPATPAATPAAKPVAFAETLPADIRGEASFRDIKDLDGLARSYLNAAKMVGLDKSRLVAIPGPDDKDGWDKVYAAIGRPEAADKYQFKAPTLPEGLKVDEKLQTAFAGKAHELGITQRQAAGLYEWWNAARAGEFTQAQETGKQRQADAMKALKEDKDFGGAAFDQNLDLARRGLAHYAGEELVAELERSGLGDHPALIKAFAKLGRQAQEDGVLGKGAGGAAAQKSPAEAQQEIAALRNDDQFMKAYGKKSAPGHAEAIEKMARLYEQAYPGAEGAAA